MMDYTILQPLCWELIENTIKRYKNSSCSSTLKLSNKLMRRIADYCSQNLEKSIHYVLSVKSTIKIIIFTF